MKEEIPTIKVPEKLTHDCENCQGLCCMAHKHRRADGFPISTDKPAGLPCSHLVTEPKEDQKIYTCNIYGSLKDDGWKVCPEFTCNGAGQAVTAFFKELGVSWAEEKPEQHSEYEWKILKINQRYAYQTMQSVFRLLYAVEQTQGEEAYKAARNAVEKVAVDFSNFLRSTNQEIDPNYWVYDRFDPEVRKAVLPLLKRP